MESSSSAAAPGGQPPRRNNNNNRKRTSANPSPKPQEQEKKKLVLDGNSQQQQQQQRGGRAPQAAPAADGQAASAAPPRRPRNRKKPSAAAASASSADAPSDAPADEDVEMTELAADAATPAITPSPALAVSEKHLSDTTFDSLANIHPLLKRALKEKLKFNFMTQVQNQTLPHIANGVDVLARAKTGTGKTVSFLLHVLSKLVANPPKERGISVLVISPTRELASQIAVEASNLLAFAPQIKVECMVGGTSVSKDQSRLRRGDLHVLIATPGRLEDHIGNDAQTQMKSVLLRKVGVLILDECDQLLEQGFRQAIQRILQALPKERQTLLFTATISEEMKPILHMALKPNHVFVDTVGDKQQQEEKTNHQVAQTCVFVPLDEQFNTLARILHKHVLDPKTAQVYKIIVFFPTARAAGFAASLFDYVNHELFPKGNNILEIHSRKSQPARTKASEQFRSRARQILFSSDVSARGLDYPDVTLVVQIGLVEVEQYIHRLGRTARAGKEGEGVLVLSPFEKTVLKKIQDQKIPIKEVALDPVTEVEARALMVLQKSFVQVGKDGTELNKAGQQAYQAFLGFYNSHVRKVGWNSNKLVEVANDYSAVMGLKEIPALPKKTIGMMGLKGVQGLRIEQ